MKRNVKLIKIILIAILIIGYIFYSNNNVGIKKSTIEKDARKHQHIYHNWQVSRDTTETMAAMIFYPEDLTDHTFSIYVNRPRVSYGYFFRGGGSVIEIEGYITEYSIEGYNQRAYISMNKQQVCRIEFQDENSFKCIEVDSKKPFAIIVPNNFRNVKIYDVYGNIIESIEQKL